MKNNSVSKKIRLIGQTEAALGVAIAISIDVSLLLFNGFDFSLKNVQLLALDALAFLFFGQIFGILASKAILVKKWPFGIVGICTAWLTLMATTVSHCFAYDAIFAARLATEIANICLVVFVFAFIPSGIHGICFGYRIYNRGKSLPKPQTHD